MLSCGNIFLALNMFYPPKCKQHNGVARSHNYVPDLKIPVKRLIFMITNGANEKYEVANVCYRGETYFRL